MRCCCPASQGAACNFLPSRRVWSALFAATLFLSVAAGDRSKGERRGLGQAASSPSKQCKGVKSQGRPNFIFLLTDDHDSALGGDWHMPQLATQIAAKGANFTSSHINFALCCPARATILSGQCAHNTGIVSLYYPLGGAGRYIERGLEKISAPLILQKAGWRTGLVGKYLNGYGQDVNESYVPPGFDRWFGMSYQGYYNWSASDQGQRRKFGYRKNDYSTDVITEEAVKFISDFKKDTRPFFLYLAPFAPHVPWIPARRHLGKLTGLKVPRVPSYNESDSSIAQKVTPAIKGQKPINDAFAATLDSAYQLRAESMLAVDEQIAAVIDALKQVGQLNNTYIFYSSDNAFKLGQRRKTGKMGPYEEDVRVPLYVRGPGIPRGIKLPHLISNTDFLPTWLELAGVADPYAAKRDGKSFAQILRSPCERARSPDTFRIGMLIEKIDTMIGSKVVSSIVPVSDQLTALKGLLPPRFQNGSLPLNVSQCETKPIYEWTAADEALCKHNYGNTDMPDDDEVMFLGVTDSTSMGLRAGWSKREGKEAKQQLAQKEKPNGIPSYIWKLMQPTEITNPHRHDWIGAYYALRIQSTIGAWKFIQYPEGYEVYDLVNDQWELTNLNTTVHQGLMSYLKSSLDSLKTCQGRNCSIDNVEQLRQALAS